MIGKCICGKRTQVFKYFGNDVCVDCMNKIMVTTEKLAPILSIKSILIINQDKDKRHAITKTWCEEYFHNGKLFGYNIYGRKCTTGKKVLLGTYDEEHDMKQVLAEIYKFMDIGIEAYYMPESITDEETEELMTGGGY